MVSGVYESVDPPAPKVTETYSGFQRRSWVAARSSCARCSSVLGGKNSKLIGGIGGFGGWTAASISLCRDRRMAGGTGA